MMRLINMLLLKEINKLQKVRIEIFMRHNMIHFCVTGIAMKQYCAIIARQTD